jgi:tetratricopeptide (TPR) repeat protein
MGVIHRDIKPANLLVDATGRLWVTDFGLARMASPGGDAGGGLTLTGDLIGTLRYMSPEQALAKRVIVDHRTDIYSLGATLYELLTLRPAFTGEDRQELLRQIAFEEPKPPRRINHVIPAELETIVLKALEKNPAERYATAQELADDLERFVKDEPIQARRPSVVQRVRKWSRRHRTGVTAALICLLVALVAGVGSVGFVLGERATRQQAAEAKVQEALDEATPRLQLGNPYDPVLVAAVQQAEAQVDTGNVAAELEGRVKQLRRDVEMLKRLDEAHLRAATGGKEGWDLTGVDRLFIVAFQGYGLDVAFPDADKAAAQVRASAIRLQLVAGLDNWAFWRNVLKKGSGAGMAAVAGRADDDPWRQRLRGAIQHGNRPARKKLAKEKTTLSQPPAYIVLVSLVLPPEEAEEVLRAAHRQYPADFWINHDLAVALGERTPSAPAESIRFAQAAVVLRPQSAVAHNSLGASLARDGRWGEAIAEYREALRINSDDALVHDNLASALAQKALLLKKQGEPDKAIVNFREAIKHKPGYAEAYISLGALLCDVKRDYDGAIEAFQTAINLRPKNAVAYFNLGNARRHKGQFEEAIAAYQNALDFLPEGDPVRPSAQGQLKQAQDLLALANRLSLVLAGTEKAGARDLATMAQMCVLYKKYHATAARLYRDALQAEPGLMAQHRYNAACAAALAGCGEGKDAFNLADKEKRRLRDQARVWLWGELELLDKQHRAGHLLGVLLLEERVAHAQEVPAFKGVRDSLDALSEPEQAAWRKLWADTDQLLKQARGSISQTTLQGVLTDKAHQQSHEQQLQAGKEYLIDMTSSAFDTYLKLLDPKGNLVAENDDIAPNNLNSRIVFTPKETGTFRIVATSFQERGRGAYTVTITTLKGKGDKKSP